ncbi:uncharacterized protein LOC142883848 [Nelusetta ayraudi]|uniref:uncharacterized protein LOC142883848 n=1 Tax=Nelusetta ayraudi TaxID=303726 RepID=UPI003F73095F
MGNTLRKLSNTEKAPVQPKAAAEPVAAEPGPVLAQEAAVSEKPSADAGNELKPESTLPCEQPAPESQEEKAPDAAEPQPEPEAAQPAEESGAEPAVGAEEPKVDTPSEIKEEPEPSKVAEPEPVAIDTPAPEQTEPAEKTPVPDTQPAPEPEPEPVQEPVPEPHSIPNLVPEVEMPTGPICELPVPELVPGPICELPVPELVPGPICELPVPEPVPGPICELPTPVVLELNNEILNQELLVEPAICSLPPSVASASGAAPDETSDVEEGQDGAEATAALATTNLPASEDESESPEKPMEVAAGNLEQAVSDGGEEISELLQDLALKGSDLIVDLTPANVKLPDEPCTSEMCE